MPSANPAYGLRTPGQIKVPHPDAGSFAPKKTIAGHIRASHFPQGWQTWDGLHTTRISRSEDKRVCF